MDLSPFLIVCTTWAILFKRLKIVLTNWMMMALSWPLNLWPEKLYRKTSILLVAFFLARQSCVAHPTLWPLAAMRWGLWPQMRRLKVLHAKRDLQNSVVQQKHRLTGYLKSESSVKIEGVIHPFLFFSGLTVRRNAVPSTPVAWIADPGVRYT